MKSRRVKALKRSWRTFLIFGISFLPKYTQLNAALHLINKDVLAIIDQEDKEFMHEHGTLQARIYFDAYIEMVKLLYVEGNNKACARSFSLMAAILDTQQFNRYLFDVSGMLAEYHPRFIEYLNEIEGKRRNA